MYNDNQTTTPNSAPGLGVNLAGNNFRNSYKSGNTLLNRYNILSGSSAEGFDRLHQKTGSSIEANFVHLFTDLYHVEQPPFFNTNDFVYLSFVLKNTGSLEQLHISGGLANLETNNKEWILEHFGCLRIHFWHPGLKRSNIQVLNDGRFSSLRWIVFKK